MRRRDIVVLWLVLFPFAQAAADLAESDGSTAGMESGTGTKYRADPDMQTVLDTLTAMSGPPIETLEPIAAREQPTPTDAVLAVLERQGKDTTPTVLVPGVTSVDGTIPGPAGSLPVRIYTPDGDGPFPVVVYYHGGGWVIADKVVYDGGARAASPKKPTP